MDDFSSNTKEQVSKCHSARAAWTPSPKFCSDSSLAPCSQSWWEIHLQQWPPTNILLSQSSLWVEHQWAKSGTWCFSIDCANWIHHLLHLLQCSPRDSLLLLMTMRTDSTSGTSPSAFITKRNGFIREPVGTGPRNSLPNKWRTKSFPTRRWHNSADPLGATPVDWLSSCFLEDHVHLLPPSFTTSTHPWQGQRDQEVGHKGLI